MAETHVNEQWQSACVGRSDSRDYTITAEVYEHFLAAFRDENPLHVDDAAAKSRGFAGKVMHGALLNGFISHFIGMVFPGRDSLLLAVDLRYANPCYLGDMIRVQTVVAQKMDTRQILVLNLTVMNLTRNSPAARGRIQVMIQGQR